MIRIRNLGEDGQDECLYEVGIDDLPAITTFNHRRTDGLAVCLAKASKAVELAETHRSIRIFQELCE